MNVKIYYTPDCPYCKELKDRLSEMKIKFESVDVSLPENEDAFKKVIEVGGTDYVPCITVGKFLLAPNVNFMTIKEASELVKHILETES